MEVLAFAAAASQAFAIVYVFAYNSIQALLLIPAFRRVRRHLQEKHVIDVDDLLRSPRLPSMSLIVPAWNEEGTIAETLRSLMRLRYPAYDIVVVNDGSIDGTLRRLVEGFGLAPREARYDPAVKTEPVRGVYEGRIGGRSGPIRLTVVDKENGGRADALNAGVNVAQGEYLCTMDADGVLEEDALLYATQPIVEDPERVVASGGQVGIINGCEVRDGKVIRVGLPGKPLPMFQVVEYLRSFTFGRTAFESLGTLLSLSGTFSVIQRKILLEVGGFLTSRVDARITVEYCGRGSRSICEDMEAIVRILRYVRDTGGGRRVAFVPYPICWTEVPETFRDLGRQRERWYRGLCEILWYHRRMLFNPRYGRVGLFALPYQLFFEGLGPLIECYGYFAVPTMWLAGLIDRRMAMLFFLSSVAYGTFVSVAAVMLGMWREQSLHRAETSVALFRFPGFRSKAKLFLYALFSWLGYRQVIVLHQVRGFFKFLRRDASWGQLTRKGFGAPSAKV